MELVALKNLISGLSVTQLTSPQARSKRVHLGLLPIAALPNHKSLQFMLQESDLLRATPDKI
jgi:hypothetical protein